VRSPYDWKVPKYFETRNWKNSVLDDGSYEFPDDYSEAPWNTNPFYFYGLSDDGIDELIGNSHRWDPNLVEACERWLDKKEGESDANVLWETLVSISSRPGMATSKLIDDFLADFSKSRSLRDSTPQPSYKDFLAWCGNITAPFLAIQPEMMSAETFSFDEEPF
jgi:hypothetical protein